MQVTDLTSTPHTGLVSPPHDLFKANLQICTYEERFRQLDVNVFGFGCTLWPGGAVSEVEADLRPPGSPLLQEIHQQHLLREGAL